MQYLSLCYHELRLKTQMQDAQRGMSSTQNWYTLEQLALIMKWSVKYGQISADAPNQMAAQEDQLVAAVGGTEALAADQAMFDTLPKYSTY